MAGNRLHPSIAVAAVQAVGILICLPLNVASLSGQPSRIEGLVRDEIDGAPIPGATVQVVGTSHKARTDSLGAYRIEKVQPGRVSVRVEAERYSAVVQGLTIEPGSTVFLQLDLQPFAVVLDRLVARGTVTPKGGEKVVEGDRLTQAGRRTGEALTARVAGARVLFSGGSVGMATQILLRGVKSMNLPGDPLYYVDGIPMSPPSAPNARNRGGEPSILDLIDPSTIERIEVIAGAAANAAFGLGSNNGVILIYTKR